MLSLLLPLLAACPAHVAKVCPRCEEVAPGRAPPLPDDTRKLYVLLPGVLGYGWEWNGAQIALGKTPGVHAVVLEWDYWRSLRAGGDRVQEGLNHLLTRLPPRTDEVVVMAHSVGGMVAALAAPRLQVPQGVRVRIVAIGTPFAGTNVSIMENKNSLDTPAPFAIGGTFRPWPAPAERVELEIYRTSWPNDPVMKPRGGHDPGDLAALPRGARLCSLPPGIDHNVAVTWVAEHLSQNGPCAPPRWALRLR